MLCVSQAVLCRAVCAASRAVSCCVCRKPCCVMLCVSQAVLCHAVCLAHRDVSCVSCSVVPFVMSNVCCKSYCVVLRVLCVVMSSAESVMGRCG